MRIQTPKDPPRFCGSFGGLNIKNRWMGIFIERKRFCHFHSLEIPWSSVVSCGPACAISLSPIVPCGVLCSLCYPVVPCCSLSPVFPHSLACSLSVLASVVVFGVLLMPLVRVGSLVCSLVNDSLLGLFVRSFVRSFLVCLFVC